MTGKLKTILYVEDDEDDREMLYDSIRHQNKKVNVDFAANGVEALTYLNENIETPPCLIVLDLNMAFVDGREAFLRIKKNEQLSKLPIIIFTSSENPADKKYFDNQGIKFFSKPTDIKLLDSIAADMVNVCCA
jgi:CheY-like chemotaxis protein